MKSLFQLAACALFSALVAATVPAAPPLSKGEIDSLAGTLRGLLIEHAPNPLYEAWPGWGHTSRIARGVEWKPGKALPLRPHLQYNEKNDGVWRHIKVTAPNLPNSLVLDLRRVRRGQPGQMLFDVFVSFDTKVHVNQERWEAGIKFFDTSARARLRVRCLLNCEATTRFESNGSIIPDAVFRLRVLQADLGYDNLVVEHVAGVGGEMAEMIGNGIHDLVKQLKPSIERDLFAKANKAIVKAGDTKEVRLGLAGLFNQKDIIADSAADLIKKGGQKK